MSGKSWLGFGIGLLIILIVAVAGAVFIGREVARVAGERASEEKRAEDFASRWMSPPPSAGAERLFPLQAGGLRRGTVEERALIPDLKFPITGGHARYGSGGEAVSIYVYRVNELEKESLFRRADDAYEDSPGGSLRTLRFPDRRVCWSSRLGGSYLWWIKGWLFVFRYRTEADMRPFIEDYLLAIGSGGGGEPQGSTRL